MDMTLKIAVDGLLTENRRRKGQIFGCHNQISGEGMEGKRKKVEIPDHSLPVQHLTDEVTDTALYRAVMEAGSIEGYAKKKGTELNEQLINDFRMALHLVRCRHDPAYAFATVFKIKDKISGKMMPFLLNYSQRILLSTFEEMRTEGKPIRLVLLKARQWGGSTLTQLYMAWIQLFLKDGWNSLIVAQTKDTARRIKGMYSKMLSHFPEYVFNAGNLKFSPSEHSAADFVITGDGGRQVRRNVITVSSFENYESVRGSDVAMAHFSEVAFWTTTLQKSADALIRAVTGGMAEGVPLTLEVMESTANGKSGYFHDEYQEAKRGQSARRALFIPFFYVENDMIPFDSEDDERRFATRLYNNRSNDVTVAKTQENGRFLWSLWAKGATLEHINWYENRRKSFHSHALMASEAPSDDVECFTFSGKLMIDASLTAEMEARFVRMPIWRSDISLIVNSPRLEPSEDGALKIWERPDAGKYINRYIVVVDVGGSSEQSDYSVITVVDLLNHVDHQPSVFDNWRGSVQEDDEQGLKVVARWRGHLRYDRMAKKAVAIATYYDEALLVFESNTFDRRRSDAGLYTDEGDHIHGILNVIRESYDNLYMRRSTQPDSIRQGVMQKVGFQTNRSTKQQMVDAFTVAFMDGHFNDPDEEFYKELAIYERRPDGSYGNIPGPNNHDDIVMTDMIACLVSNTVIPPTPAYTNNYRSYSPRRGTCNESAF